MVNWINANNKTPNTTRDVLFWGEGHSVAMGYYDKDVETIGIVDSVFATVVQSGFFAIESNYDGEELVLKKWATHWCEIPEPPK